MRRPRHEIEAEVPRRGRPGRPGEPGSTSLPQIRRQVERICESLDLVYDDLVELRIVDGSVSAFLYHRNDEGELHRDEFDKVVLHQVVIPVDLSTFLGDERDR